MAGSLVVLSVVCLFLFPTRRTEVTLTPQPKSGHTSADTAAGALRDGTEPPSPASKGIASTQGPSNTPPLSSEHAAQIRARRDETLKGLSERSFDLLMEDLIVSCMPAMGPGGMPADPRMTPSFRESRIPDRFILVGKLAAVRAVYGKTWVYLWSEIPMHVLSAQVVGTPVRGPPLPPSVIGIEMDSEEVAQWMADYRLDDIVRVVAESETWVSYAPPAMRIFQAPPGGFAARNGGLVCYWFFRGEGLEKLSQPGVTWIDAELGRTQLPGNFEALKRSPGFVLRKQSSLAGTAIRVTARFHSVAQNGNDLLVHLTIPDSAEGPIPVVVNMGKEVELGHFLDYKQGATVDAEIILQQFAVEQWHWSRRSNGQPTPLEMATMSPGLAPPIYTSTILDPLTGWGVLTATGRHLQLQGDPSSLIPPDGPSRQKDPADRPVTPDVAHADKDAVGKPVVWSGTLSQVAAQDGETHLLVAIRGESIFGLTSFEGFTSDPDFLNELVDYRQAVGSQDPGDAVSVSGVVCATDAAKVRLKSDVPLVEIKQIQREGDLPSRAIVGQKRDPKTLRADPVTDRGRATPAADSGVKKEQRRESRTAADAPGRAITQKESESIHAAKQSGRRLQNGDFRDGLTGWSTEDAGGAFSVFRLGDQMMITSYGPKQEASQGRVYQCFTIPDAAELKFFVHGGQDPEALYVALWAGERLIYRVTGRNDNEPSEVRWDLSELKSQTVTLEIRDAKAGAWGFIGAHGFEVLEHKQEMP
jgi:hypothetical protein